MNNDEKIIKFSVQANNIKNAEILLFGMDEKDENDGLNNKQIDDILFDDFKEKLLNEQDDYNDDDDYVETHGQQYEKTLEKISAKISLEDAVDDFRAGYAEAFEYIYSHYKPILVRYGKRYNNEELAMELLDIVLLNAVKTFDNQAKTKFNTYYWKCIHNHVNCDRIKNGAQKRAHNKDMKSLNEKARYKGDTTDNELEGMIEDSSIDDMQKQKELKLAIMSLSDCLKENEITMLLKIIDNYTLQEIGDSLGITAAAVCMSLKRIARKTKPAKYLREILHSH